MNLKLINEVFWLRCIACLAVTFGHGLQSGYSQYVEPSFYHIVAYFVYMSILFGVPVFVFISEFLLSHKYSEGVPKGFLLKRFKILIAPYVFMSIIYALFDVSEWSVKIFTIEVLKNIFLGNSTVYFVLIIFQFYILHIYLSRFLAKISPMVTLPVSFLVSAAYLSVFNFIEPPNNPYAVYIWNPGYWMPFIGWFFYFVLGYYCGRNYESVLKVLRKFNKLFLAFPIMSLGLMFLMNKYFLISQDSKRIDMLIYASSMTFLIIYVTSYFKTTPRIVMLISNYSFSIFLLNELFFLLFQLLYPPAYLNLLTYSIIVFVLSISCSVGTSYLLNRFNLGKYLVGNVMNFGAKNNPNIKQSA